MTDALRQLPGFEQVQDAGTMMATDRLGQAAQNLKPEDFAKVAEKVGWFMEPSQLATAFGEAEKVAGTGLTAEQSAQATAKALDAVGQATANEASVKADKAATEVGSIYTHDIHSEKMLQNIAAALGADTMTKEEEDDKAFEDVLSSLGLGGEGGDVKKDPLLQATEDIVGGGEEQAEEVEATTATLADIYNVLRVKGIRIQQSHLNNDIKKVIKDASQEAMEEALFEFALLTDPEAAQGALADAIASGGTTTGSSILRGIMKSTETDVKSGGYAKRKAEREAALNPPPDPNAPPPDPNAPPVVPPAPAAGLGASMGIFDVNVRTTLELTGGLDQFVRKVSDEVVSKRFSARAPK